MNWNMIVTARDQGFTETRRALRKYGHVEETDFYNILLVKVKEIDDFLQDFKELYEVKPYLQDCISRIRPMMKLFEFASKDEFEAKLKIALAPWMDKLQDKSFHVRAHRRGEHVFSELEEEQFFDRHVLSILEAKGHKGRIDFKDPDFFIDIETVNYEGGVSLWSREDLKNYPFIHA